MIKTSDLNPLRLCPFTSGVTYRPNRRILFRVLKDQVFR